MKIIFDSVDELSIHFHHQATRPPYILEYKSTNYNQAIYNEYAVIWARYAPTPIYSTFIGCFTCFDCWTFFFSLRFVFVVAVLVFVCFIGLFKQTNRKKNWFQLRRLLISQTWLACVSVVELVCIQMIRIWSQIQNRIYFLLRVKSEFRIGKEVKWII